MIDVQVKFPKIELDHTVVNNEARRLADNLESSLVNFTKLSLISFGKIATGRNLKAIKGINVSERLLQPFGKAATGQIKRQVVGDRSLRFIISGRKAGRKMPVRVVGTGPRGGKIFQPLPAMLEWFNIMNIPRSAWFPILRAIKMRGIAPANVPQQALRMAKPAINRYTQTATMNIARGIIKVSYQGNAV